MGSREASATKFVGTPILDWTDFSSAQPWAARNTRTDAGASIWGDFYQIGRPIMGRCASVGFYALQAGSRRPPARLAGVSGEASMPAEGNGIESVSGGGVAPSGVSVLGALPEVGEGRVIVVFMSTLSNGPEASGGLGGTGGAPTPGTGAPGGKGAIGGGVDLEPLELIRRSRLLNRRSSSFNLRSRRSTRPTTSPRANVAVPDELEDDVGVPNP